MATATKNEIDFAKIRKDFPLLEREMNGKPIVFLDSAASSQKPKAVVDALENTFKNVFFFLLKTCLSAIIIVALKGMFMQLGELPTFMKKDIFDGLLWLGTFLGVVFLDIDR